jgi:hypothetical protein
MKMKRNGFRTGNKDFRLILPDDIRVPDIDGYVDGKEKHP